MSTAKFEHDFYSKLMTETCSIAEEVETNKNVLSFEEYFESKRNLLSLDSVIALLEKYNVIYSIAEEIAKNQVLRFRFGHNILDFPQNWSIFARHFSDLKNTIVLVDEANDPDFLASVTSSFYQKPHNLLFISDSDNLFMALIDKEASELIFKLQNMLEIKKVA